MGLKNFLETELLWRTAAALRANWVAFTVLFFSMGIKALVNQVEQPFARSLVACDIEVEPDTYTGSRWCGDRLRVIQDGMYLSAVGQGQENFAMLCSLTFVIIITGIWGPRVSLALGLTGVTVSVVLFVIASTSPDLGRSLFAIGQGLQGLYPIEYLTGILMLHMAILPGADGEANFQVMSYMGIFSNIFWQVALGSVVQFLELTNYGKVWTSILGISATILGLTLFAFPEMRPMDQDKYKGKSPIMKVIGEVLSYRDLLYDWRARRYLLKIIFESITGVYPYTVVPGSLMAYHGWSQVQLTFCFFWPQFIQMLAMPYYKKVLLDRFGYFQTYVWSVRYLMLMNFVVAPVSLAYTDKLYIFQAYMNAIFGGFYSLKGFVDSRFAEPEQMQRFQSVQWIMGYFLGTWSGPMFASSFDAAAQTPFERSTPALLLFGWFALYYWSVFYLIYDMDGVQGFAVTVRVLDEGDKKGKILWWLVAQDGGQNPEGMITAEKWGWYNLKDILGKEVWEVGGAVYNYDHWTGILGSMNQTPAQGHLLLQRLDYAIQHANGVHQAYREAMMNRYFPELEGVWVPIKCAEWEKPADAEHPKTQETWDASGNATFQNSDNEAGTLTVVNKHEDVYHGQWKLLSGPGAGQEGYLTFSVLPDGTIVYPALKRYLRRREEQNTPAAEAQPAADAASVQAESAEGAVEPPATEGNLKGADEPAPEGKKDA